jgi:hypothetical protein
MLALLGSNDSEAQLTELVNECTKALDLSGDGKITKGGFSKAS